MRLLLGAFLLLLCGCPKKDVPTLDEIERQKELQELLEEEDEIFDDLPEAGDESEREKSETVD